MQKALFLEYKFGDYDTEMLRRSGANLLIVWRDGLTIERITTLKKLETTIATALPAFVASECPANPKAMDAWKTDLIHLRLHYIFGKSNKPPHSSSNTSKRYA